MNNYKENLGKEGSNNTHNINKTHNRLCIKQTPLYDLLDPFTRPILLLLTDSRVKHLNSNLLTSRWAPGKCVILN